MTITFVIDEGPRFKLRNVSVIGNIKYTNEVLMADLKLKTGDYFNQAKMMADKNSFVNKYGSIGYVFADIKPDVRYLAEAAQLDLIYHINEGDRYRVGKINVVIKGEYPHTQLTTVLNRLSLKPGDVVDIREIRASERRLKASQLFEVTPTNAPKIVFSPPGQEPEEDEEVAEKSKTKSDRGGGRRGMGRGFGGGSGSGGDSDGDSGPTFRGQSPNAPSRDRVLNVTLDCGRYVGPPREAKEAVEDDSLEQRGRALSEALAKGKLDRSRTILTQYSPSSGQVYPASEPAGQSFGNAPAPDQAYGAGQPQAPPAYGQADASQPAQPAPAYGQQMWPSRAPQRPVDSPDGPYMPGPIFSEDSPFRDAPPDGADPASLLPFKIAAQEAMTGRVMVGVGINSEAGLVGSVVLDEQNFDWTRWPTSWEDIRNGTWLRGNGQRFRLEAAPASPPRPARSRCSGIQSPSKTPTCSIRKSAWR